MPEHLPSQVGVHHGCGECAVSVLPDSSRCAGLQGTVVLISSTALVKATACCLDRPRRAGTGSPSCTKVLFMPHCFEVVAKVLAVAAAAARFQQLPILTIPTDANAVIHCCDDGDRRSAVCGAEQPGTFAR